MRDWIETITDCAHNQNKEREVGKAGGGRSFEEKVGQGNPQRDGISGQRTEWVS